MRLGITFLLVLVLVVYIETSGSPPPNMSWKSLKKVVKQAVLYPEAKEAYQKVTGTAKEKKKEAEDTITETKKEAEDTITEKKKEAEDTITETKKEAEDTITETKKEVEETAIGTATNLTSAAKETAIGTAKNLTSAAKGAVIAQYKVAKEKILSVRKGVKREMQKAVGAFDSVFKSDEFNFIAKKLLPLIDQTMAIEICSVLCVSSVNQILPEETAPEEADAQTCPKGSLSQLSHYLDMGKKIASGDTPATGESG